MSVSIADEPNIHKLEEEHRLRLTSNGGRTDNITNTTYMHLTP